MYDIQYCFIYRPSDSTVSEDAGIEPRTVATLALTARRSNHLARSHPLILAHLYNLAVKDILQTFLLNMAFIKNAEVCVIFPPISYFMTTIVYKSIRLVFIK
jgi:hypothetical protein